MHFLSLACLLLAGCAEVFAKYDKDKKNNLAVYWGQNSLGSRSLKIEDQSRLSSYCDATEVDIIIIAFVVNPNAPDHPLLNFANQGGKCKIKDQDASDLLSCPQIEEDINMCKTKYGKTILLSIGGDSAKISFASEEEAKQNARDIWHMFGATPASKFDTTKPRPFGHAVIDGIDIDVESETKYLKDWAQEMRALTTKDNSYFTAAPQCPKEEDPMNEVMSNVAFDAAFVQFYNTPKCMFGGPNHDDTITKWNTWAEGLPNTTFFMGLPGSDSATTNPGTGYLAPDTMKDAVKKAKSFSKFSGVMLWDMSQVVGNDNYHLKVRTALDAQ